MIQKINEYESFASTDGYFRVTNLGGFTAIFYATYIYNRQFFSLNSGVFSLFYYREIKIPVGATAVHLYVLASNGLGQWTTIYNNNFISAPVVELKLWGTIWYPYATILSDSNKTKTRILATNNAAFITRYKLIYYIDRYPYTLESKNFSTGMSREIAIPNIATDLIVEVEYFEGFFWEVFYTFIFKTPRNVDLTFSGYVGAPRCTQKIGPPISSENEIPKKEAVLICSKKPHTNISDLNDIITFAIHVVNFTLTPAHDVMLEENLSKELEFVLHSFKINGISLEHIDLSSPVRLGDIQINSSFLVTYKVKVILIPKTNKITDEPILRFSYLDQNDVVTTSLSKGVAITLNVGQDSNNNCYPCSNCQCL